MQASAAPDRTGSFRVDVLIERTGEAARVVKFLSEPDRQLAVLHGRTNCGKSKLVRNFVMPEFGAKAYYGATVPDIPETVSGKNGPVSLVDALSSGGIVFLDEFDQLLAAGGKRRMEQAAALLGSLHRREYGGKLVLIVQDDNLAQLLSFRSEAPSLLDNTCEVRGLPLSEHIQKLGEFGGPLSIRYSPEVLEWLGRDLQEFGALGSGDIAEAVDWGFRHYKGSSTDRVITGGDYSGVGLLPGVIRECLNARMHAAEMRFGNGAAAVTKAIAEEVVESARFSRPTDFEEIAPRLAIAPSLLKDVLAWAQADGRLLRADAKEGVGLIPRELARVVESELEPRWREQAEAHRILTDGIRSHKQLNAVLPRERFDPINRNRTALKTNPDETALMTLSALHYPDDQADAPYWLARVRDRDAQISVLIEALFAESATSRLKAARLLAGFEDEEVLSQLYRKALEDPDSAVREQAIESLSGMKTEELWTPLEQEAKDKSSPYRLNAIEAMRLCRCARCVATLKQIIDEPAAADLRAAAIRALSLMQLPEAVDALVDTSLNSEEDQDRAGAAQSVASLKSPALLARALDTARAFEARAGRFQLEPFQEPLRVLMALGLMAVNNIFHGASLIPLGRADWAAYFFLVELAALFLGKPLGGWLFGANLIASHFVATRLAMQSVGKEWRGVRITHTLGAVFFVMWLPVVLVIHGVAHALTRRWARALMLFCMELASFAIFVLGYFFFNDYQWTHHWPEKGFYGLFWFYALAAAALFAISFWLDLKEVFVDGFLLSGRTAAKMREDALVGQVLATSPGTQAALQLAEGSDGKAARWAQDALLRPPWALSHADLIARLEKLGESAPAFLDSSLARNKTDESLRGLASLWDRTNSERFRTRILRVLLAYPSEQSLREVSTRLPKSGYWVRLRYHIARWLYPLRLWPRGLTFGAALAIPFLVYSIIEVKESTENPSHTLVHHMRASYHRGDHTLGVNTAQFLAENHAEHAFHHILELYTDTAGKDQQTHDALSASVAALACSKGADFRDLQNALPGTDQKLRVLGEAGRRQQCDNGSRQQIRAVLEREGAAVLANQNAEAELVHLAIGGLETAATPEAVKALENYAIRDRVGPRLRSGDKALTDQESRRRENELKVEAIDSLVRLNNRAALESVAEKALIRDVGIQARRRVTNLSASDPIRNLQTAFNSADYDRVIRDGTALKSPTSEQKAVIYPLLAQSYYRKSLDPGQDREKLESQAIEYFERAVIVNRQDIDVRRSYAELLNIRAERARSAGKLDESLQLAKKAIEQDDTFADAYGTKGAVLQAQGKRDAAIEAYTAAIKYNPRYAWAYCALAEIDLADENYDQAKERAENAISADPNYSWSYYLLSESYTRRGQKQEAIDRFEQLARDRSSLYWPGRQLAVLYHDHSPDPTKGLELSYQKWVELDKRFASALDPATLRNHRSNFLESSFTAKHYEQVLRDGPKLADTLETDLDLRVPVIVLTYAAALMQNDKNAARAQLDRLVIALRETGDHRPPWDYSGTVAHLQAAKLSGPWVDPLMKLLDAAQGLRDGKRFPASVIELNRKAL